MRERRFSVLDRRLTAESANHPWFEIQLLTVMTPSSMEPELSADVPDEPMGYVLEDEDLCSEHTVRVLGYQQARSRQEACQLYLADNGFETMDQFLDGYSGFPNQITELVAQDDLNDWVEVDPEEYLESFD